MDDLVSHSGEEYHEPDAFAHLLRDQQHSGSAASARAGQGAGGAYPPPHAQSPAHHGGGGTPYQAASGNPMQPPVPAPAGPSGPGRPPPPPAPAPAKGRASGLLKSSAVMAAGTMVSRLTGFVRILVIIAALGVGVLGDTFQVAYTLPTMIYILTVGGGLNSVFVPQLVRSMKDDEDGGEAFANRLLTLVMVALAALTVADGARRAVPGPR